MKKYAIILVIVCALGYPYGVRPSFDVGAGWSYISSEGESEDMFAVGLGTTVPYCRYVGLTAGIFGAGFGDGWTEIDLGSQIGFIEMIPNPIASLVLEQLIVLNVLTLGGSTLTNFDLGLGVGVEFLSDYYVSPYIGGQFRHTALSGGGASANGNGFGFNAGVRVSWIK